MVVAAGIIRLMGIERFERLVIDLCYNRQTFKENVQRYVSSAYTLPEGSIFKTFVKEPNLKGLPIVNDEQKLERLPLGDYPLYDRTGISLSDFIRYRDQKFIWGNAPTREGRAMLAQAFNNLKKVMIVYHGTHYTTCCDDVLTVLEENMDVLRNSTTRFYKSNLRWSYRGSSKTSTRKNIP